MRKTILAIVFCLFALPVMASDRPASRVWFIGIDGVRTDALLAIKAPHLQKLIADGSFSPQTTIIGPREHQANTISGPGWSNLLTGVWPDKHGVLDNDFKTPHYDEFPHFFKHVKDAYPQAKTHSICNWGPIHTKIVTAADESIDVSEPGKGIDHYRSCDEKIGAKTVEVFASGDPDVLFSYFGSVDGTGHAKGFHPSVPEYRESLELVDGHIGKGLDALRARAHFDEENWLILVGTDHGGIGKGHGDGHTQPEVNTVWLIVSGKASASGTIDGPTGQVDLVATALSHLKIANDPAWQLDGKAVGLKN